MISIIIVNYNVKAYLEQCIKSILSSISNLDFEIIIVDNNSRESVDGLKSDKISVYSMDNNLGFSSAVNFGLSKAKKDVVFLLNPDIIVGDQAIEKLYNYILMDSSIGVVGCKVLNPDGTYQLSSKRSFPYFFNSLSYVLELYKIFPNVKFFNHYNYLYADHNKILDVDAISGSCMVFRREILNVVGYFDEKFFLYFEDTDFCLRVIDSGYKVVYYPEASILHYKGESLKLANTQLRSEFYLSLKYFFYKYKNKFNYWPLIKILLPIGILVRRFIVSVKKY